MNYLMHKIDMMNLKRELYMVNLKYKLYKIGAHLEEDDGIGVVEMILILVVLVALVMVFKSQLNELVSNIFDSINSKSSGIYN